METQQEALLKPVKDCWFNVRVDSLSEESFTPVDRSDVKDKNKSGF